MTHFFKLYHQFLEQTILIYKALADCGQVEFMYQYCYANYYGIGTETNKEEKAKYFRMAVEKGDISSYTYYMNLILNEVISIDKEEVLKFVKNSADNSDGKDENLFRIFYIAIICR